MTTDRGPPPKTDYELWTQEALNSPGKIHAAYSAFWEYSFGNQLLAMSQLAKPEPIASFNGWKAVDRHVVKGSKAIALLMPVSKKTEKDNGEEGRSTFFMMRHYWFPISMTAGADFTPPPIPDFDILRAADQLSIRIEDFQSVNGNAQGYAKTEERTIALNPIAYDSLKTTAHEIAHVLLHKPNDGISRPQRECEAELCGYLLKCALGVTAGLEYSRGYIANWMRDDTKEKIRYGEVFKAVDLVLKAGRIEAISEPERPAAKHRQSEQRPAA